MTRRKPEFDYFDRVELPILLQMDEVLNSLKKRRLMMHDDGVFFRRTLQLQLDEARRLTDPPHRDAKGQT